MRAVRLAASSTPLEALDVAEPATGPQDVKIRIEACGICHSDAHYRGGFGNIDTPRTLGHEIAGSVIEVGERVHRIAIGDRVAVHYLRSCGECHSCKRAGEQFCEFGQMIGKHCDGGYAESIVVPAQNAIPIPDNVPTEIAAVMMCSTATAYHALRVAGIRPGQSLAILGFGGLGVSAFHVARAIGIEEIAVVDAVPEKLAAARALGAETIETPDVAIDFTGNPDVIVNALKTLAPRGTVVLVALSERAITFNPYRDVLGTERRIIGCSDHLRSELFELMELASMGKLNLGDAISQRVTLEAGAINGVLDELERGTAKLRSVIVLSGAAAPPPPQARRSN